MYYQINELAADHVIMVSQCVQSPIMKSYLISWNITKSSLVILVYYASVYVGDLVIVVDQGIHINNIRLYFSKGLINWMNPVSNIHLGTSYQRKSIIFGKNTVKS